MLSLLAPLLEVRNPEAVGEAEDREELGRVLQPPGGTHSPCWWVVVLGQEGQGNRPALRGRPCAQPVPLDSARAAYYSGHSYFGRGMGFIFTWSCYLNVAWNESEEGKSL